jgi:hypothetical protein
MQKGPVIGLRRWKWKSYCVCHMMNTLIVLVIGKAAEKVEVAGM